MKTYALINKTIIKTHARHLFILLSIIIPSVGFLCVPYGMIGISRNGGFSLSIRLSPTVNNICSAV